MREFLETDKASFWAPHYLERDNTVTGLNLLKHALKKIYSENFERITSKEPRELNIDAGIKECKRQKKNISKLK